MFEPESCTEPGPPDPWPELPPPLELECLKELWAVGEANVETVRDRLAGRRDLAYTTVMTCLSRLARRRLVTRRKAGRAYLYAPAVSREVLRERAVARLLEGFFDGSAEALRAYMESAAPQVAAPAPHGSQPPAPQTAEDDDRLDTALL